MLIADFIKLALSTDEVQQLTRAVSSELLQSWAEKSWIKKRIAKRVEKKLHTHFQSENKDFTTEIISFLEEQNLAPVLLSQLPLGINGMIDVSLALMRDLEKLSAQEKTELAGKIIDKTTLHKSGELLTGTAAFLNEIHNGSPTFFTEKMAPHLNQWLVQTDFGELREALEKSEEDVIAWISAINESLSQSPAKMVCLYSCVPLLINIGVAGVLNSLVVHNTMAPEILADILCSLVKDIKTQPIGFLLNESNELLRKILTGSALLSDSGGSVLSKVLAEKTTAIHKELDFDLVYKVQKMLAKAREQYESDLIEKSKHNPDQAIAYFRRLITPFIDAPRTWNRKIAAIEELLTDEQISEETARCIAEIDVPELAETVNLFLTMVNTISPMLSEKGTNPMAQFVSALDVSEVSETIKMMTDDTVKSLKPIANEVMPHLVRGVTELLRPEAGENNTELAAALAEFRSVISQENVN